MPEYTRHDERIRVMQAFYQIFLYLESGQPYDATEILVDLYEEDDYASCPPFSQAVYALGLEHFDELKKIVSDHLVNWSFQRIDHVAKAILFTSLSEGLYLRKTPRNVIINEGVSLAKNFLKPNDYKFINAVLDKALPKDE